jgi:long-chain acyl-CoA synthetase
MQPDFWSGKRPDGVPDNIDLQGYTSLVDVITHSFKQFGERPAFSNMGRTLTYSDLDRLSAAFAAYLQQKTSLKPGDRIAIQLPNLLQYPVAVFGALRAGLVVVNTNPLYTAREMRHQFQDSGTKALIYLNLFGARVEEVLPDTPIKYLIECRMGDLQPLGKGWLMNAVVKHGKKLVPAYHLPQAVLFKMALAQGNRQTLRRHDTVLDDIAVLQYTGGTTGVAKGAMLSHRNLIANMLQLDACLKQRDASGEPVLRKGEEVVISPLPLYHIYAFTVTCMCMLFNGSHSVLITNPRDIAGLIKEMSRWRFTAFLGLNTLFVALMEHPTFRALDFSHLRFTNSGGTALVRATAEQWTRTTGCLIMEGYGLTEASPIAALNPHGNLARLGTVGLPVPGTHFKIIGESGEDLSIGERGELCIRGPQVMKGYWGHPDATDEVLDAQGWYRTGDIAIIDAEGYTHIVDRKKDLIIVSGFNVYPNEVEEVVMAHPNVANCAAIGVPDEKSGEAVKLFVVPREMGLTVDELKTYCRVNLTGYKVPKHIVVRESLPMTPVGKVLRRELRDLA